MRCIILGLLALAWSAVAGAASNLHFGPPQQWVKPTPLPAAGAATQAAVKILLLDYQVELTPRTVRYYVESATHIQTPEGLSKMGTITLVWNPDTDVVTVHRIRILRGKKVINVLGAGQTFTIARRETNLDYQALDDTLTGILEPAGLQVGDTVDVAYTLERSDPILAGTYAAQVGISPEVPVSRLHVSAQWPASDPVEWRATEGLTGVQQTHGHGTSGVTVTMSDVLPILQPKGAPPRFMIARRIEFSGLGSWGEVARRLAPLYEQAARLAADSPLQAQITRIRAATTDPKERAALALELVQDQIRYLLLAMNNGGLVPATADQTWARRYGDCKAKTVLLLALLHGLNIQAQPVAVSVAAGDGLDERLPSVALFDHVLVEATIGGQNYWLDGTRMGDRSLGRLQVPYYHWGLPLVTQSPALVKMVPTPLAAPLLEKTISIDATGGVSRPAPFHGEIAFHGYAAVVMQQGFGNLAPAQLDAGLRAAWAKQFSFVTVHSVAAAYDEKAEIERLTMDGTARMDWGANEYSPPGLMLGYDADFGRQAGPHRDAPFAVPYPTYSTLTVSIKLPVGGHGFSITGGGIDQTLAGFEYRRQARINNGVFTAVASARSVQPEFPSAEAAADQKALHELLKSTLELHSPGGHTPTEAEIAWGLPPYNNTAADYVNSGKRLFQHRMFEAATADFNAALALDSHDALALVGRAAAYAYQGDDERARADYTAALAVDPHDTFALDGSGWVAMSAGDSEGAILAFTKAIAIDPKDDYAFQNRGLVYWRLGKSDQALADLDQAVRLNPTMLNRYWMRALILQQQGRKAEALQQARLAIAVAPSGYQPYFEAGAIYMQLGEQAKATAAFDHGASMAPGVSTYLERAALRPWNQLAARRADIESALKHNSSSSRALTMLAEVQLTAGQYRDAVASLTNVMRNEHGSPSMLTLRGIAYAKDGQTALANEDFAKALKQAKLPTELNDICRQLSAHDVSLESALDDCNSAISSEPHNVAFLDSRGFVLLRLGRCDKAIADYDAVLRIDPLQPTSLYGRSICELREGKTGQAQADMRAAMLLSYQVADQFTHYGVRP